MLNFGVSPRVEYHAHNPPYILDFSALEQKVLHVDRDLLSLLLAALHKGDVAFKIIQTGVRLLNANNHF